MPPISLPTPGLLTVRRYHGNRYELIIGPVEQSHFVVAHVKGFANGEAAANARRLVACWNLCAGLETAALEAGPTLAELLGELVRGETAQPPRGTAAVPPSTRETGQEHEPNGEGI